MMKWIGILVVAFLVFSCREDEQRTADVSGISIDVPLVRMEQEVAFEAGNDTLIREDNDKWLEQFGEPYDVLVQIFLRVGSPEDPMIGEHLNLSAKSGELDLFGDVNADLKSQFSDFSSYEKELVEAMKHYHHYFPDSALPKEIVTMNTYFNAQSYVTTEDSWCIGLDMFLGASSEHLKLLPPDIFPAFLKEKMEPKYLVSSAVQAWLLEKCYVNTGEAFLDKIVAAGKIMYLMDVMMPNKSDADKIQFTEQEIQWCENNQENVWKELVDNKTLFTKDPTVIDNWIKDGPFTKGLPQESPSRVGRWLGWQMVKDYMRKNPEVTIPQLVQEQNPNRILKHYKPGE